MTPKNRRLIYVNCVYYVKNNELTTKQCLQVIQ